MPWAIPGPRYPPLTKIRRILAHALGILALFIVVGAVGVYGLQSAAINGQSDRFTVGTAVVVVGYLMFPALAILSLGLLLVALMLLAAYAIERGRSAQ
jgi:uncharacterized membrane protein YgdD (TMEM256/DUF423 family)